MTRVTRYRRRSRVPRPVPPENLRRPPAGARASGLTKIPNKEVSAMPTGHIDSQEASDFPLVPLRPPRRQERRETSAKEIFPISTALLKEIFLTRTECVMYDENDDRINTPAGVKPPLQRRKLFISQVCIELGSYLASRHGDLCPR